ncbi:MAG: hypothetical protein JWN08_664, partial [Frankiales bacterium]|nr:hypothetical protein [Frankiales bacterium]
YKFTFGGNFNNLFPPAPNATVNVSGSGPAYVTQPA